MASLSYPLLTLSPFQPLQQAESTAVTSRGLAEEHQAAIQQEEEEVREEAHDGVAE